MMSRLSKVSILALAFLLLGNLLVVGAKQAIAQGASNIAITTSTSEAGKPACWVAIGNKLYFVEKDETTILKVKASAAL